MHKIVTILSNHNCAVLPTEQNLKRLLEEISHKELVQQRAFIIKCWESVLKSTGESMRGESLDKILVDPQTKPRGTTKLIQCPNSMTPAEQTPSHHLLRFVREMDEKETGLTFFSQKPSKLNSLT